MKEITKMTVGWLGTAAVLAVGVWVQQTCIGCAYTLEATKPLVPCATPQMIETKESRLFPAVGVLYLNGGRGLCTATLVAPDRLITAAHCVGHQSAIVESPSDQVAFKPQGSLKRYPAVAWWSSSAEKSKNGFLDDVAIVLLAEPVPLVQPLRVASNYPADTSTLAVVGYGCHVECTNEDGTRSHLGVGKKRAAFVPASSFVFSRYTSSKFWVCGGDSGGPVVDLQTNQIVGLVAAASDQYMYFSDAVRYGHELDDE